MAAGNHAAELTLTLPVRAPFKPVAIGFVCNTAAAIGFTRHEIEQLELAVDEALTNVAQHALADAPDATYTVRCRDTGTGIAVSIREKGMPFDPNAVPAYDPQRLPANPEQAGLGLHLMRQLTDAVEFRNLGRDGKETILTKHLAAKRVDALPATAREKPAPGSRRAPARHLSQ